MKRTVLFVLVLLLAAVLGGLLWWIRPSNPLPAHDTPIAVPGDGGATTEHSLDSARTQRDRTLGVAPVSEPVTPDAHATTLQRGAFELRIVDKHTGEPVPKANVHWLPVPDSEHVREGMWRALAELFDEVEARGQHAEADDEGCVRLDRIEATTMVVAEHEGLAGWITISRRNVSPEFIELVPDPTLRVQVVDSREFPCPGITVTLRSRAAYSSNDVVRVVTREPDGMAEIPHAGMQLAFHAPLQTSIAIAGALEPPVEVPVDASAMPKGTVRLMLPATGAVEVWLRHKDGRVYTEPVEVGLQCLRPGVADPRQLARDRTSSSFRVTSIGGRAFFAHVSLNCAVEATAIRPGRESECRVRADGPREVGERATLLLDIDADPLVPTIEAQVVDEAKRPIASARLTARTYAGTPPVPMRTTQLRTDTEGRFQLEIHDEHFEEGPLRLLVCETSNDSRALRGVEVPLPKELAVGVIPIGQLVLAPGERIASGRVVDDAGAPLARAEVSVLARDVTFGNFPDWLHASTDDFGRFEVRGWLQASRLSLRASKADYGTETVDIEPGTTGLDIALHSAGSITGSVLLATDFPRNELQVRCEREGGEVVDGGTQPWFLVRAGGKFLVPQLRPGTYRVQIRLLQEAHALVDAGGIIVRAGEVNADPRLQEIDLRTRLHAFEIVVRAYDNRPIPEIETMARNPRAPTDAPRRNEFHNGRARFVTTAESLDVVVSAEGFRTAQILGLDGTRSLVLQPAIEIELVLRGATPPPAPFALQPILLQQFGEEDEAGWGEAPFDAEGRTRRHVPAPGKYAVQLGIQTGELFRGETWVELAADPTIEVRDVTELQRFEIQLEKKDLENALPKPPK